MGRDGQHKEKARPRFCWTETNHCLLWWLPCIARLQGSYVQHSSAPYHLPLPILLPQMALPLYQESRGLFQTSLHLYPVFARASPLPPSSLHLLLYCNFSLVGGRGV